MTAVGPRAVEAKGSHRERKRARTWAAIHLAAAEAAALHDRLADVTVEAVAEQAEISPRTFFNYFKSKEDAVLGQQSPVIHDEIADSFHIEAGDDLVEKVAFLLLAVFRTSVHRLITYSDYVALLDRHPELSRRRLQHIDAVEALVADLVTARLAESQVQDIPLAGHERHTVEETALLIVTVAGAVMRTAMRPVLDLQGGTGGDADSILRRTCALFREVTRP
ncbi:TetR/AcrR family transcriptional regulator [Rhodococcus coprophilus]|uniref:TetR family transcriptional regulator n=1 Tax=Rhodococcus coprophilus TaxID=38310 RepID=A0A2X4UK87_9NOCA|nr:TetR family transcriptional regulator [Rhodococcus coprophilus]MBM7458738.1 AcrR family transcriptional regulator [Rhodococcus coprophilus]SQI33320.1 TetR family transcriptional regulator [Rhodococcus coprophilus]